MHPSAFFVIRHIERMLNEPPWQDDELLLPAPGMLRFETHL